MATRKTKETEEDALAARFVDEYLVDFDPFLAAVRAGIPRLQAKPKAKVLMATMAVQKAIVERVDAMKPADIATPQRILMGLMREAGKSAFGSDRIGALKTVHEILKDVRKQAKEDAEDAKAGKKGGVMLVPGNASLTDWEKAATAAQAELKRKVTE
jgi:phage terminase small subunit